MSNATPHATQTRAAGGRRSRLQSPRDPVDPARFVARHIDLIGQITGHVARRLRVPEDDHGDFRSWVALKLLENGGRAIRRYRGESSLRSYLTVVISNLGRDYKNMRWGKWRPSAAARRLGECAVELERLIHRDGASRQEACAILVSRGECTHSAADLMDICARLPHRPRRMMLALDGCSLSLGTDPETDLMDSRAEAAAREAFDTLAGAIEQLDPEDRLLVRLRYFDGLRVSEVARMMQMEQKPLYRRYERILIALKSCLIEAGVDGPGIAA